MRLASAVLGFLLRGLGKLGGVLLALFLITLAVQALLPAVRESAADLDRLQQVTEERAALEKDLEELRKAAAEGQSRALESLGAKVDEEVAAGRSSLAAKKAEIERLRDDQSEVCGLVDKAIAVLMPGNACKSAEEAVAKADEALDTVERNLEKAEAASAVLSDPALTPQEKLDRLAADGETSPVEREIQNKESELGQKKAEQASLEDARSSGMGWVVNQWFTSWRWLLAVALLVLVVPVLLRVVNYFVLMPLVSRAHRRVLLADEPASAAADLRVSEAQRTLSVELGPGEVLYARSEHVRPVQGKIRSRVLYKWSSPFISFAAGLYGLSQVFGQEGGSSATLATPDDPNSYLMRIDFTDHPGLVMYPKHVVGVLGSPTLETRWRWGIQAFATWQVRYIMFVGTGSLIVQGSGDVVATSPRGGSTRMEQHLVMGFDSRLTLGVNRTEVFLPYLWGRTPLVDDEFSGDHLLFWQKSSPEGPSNPVARTFDAIFSAIGKVFGF